MRIEGSESCSSWKANNHTRWWQSEEATTPLVVPTAGLLAPLLQQRTSAPAHLAAPTRCSKQRQRSTPVRWAPGQDERSESLDPSPRPQHRRQGRIARPQLRQRPASSPLASLHRVSLLSVPAAPVCLVDTRVTAGMRKCRTGWFRRPCRRPFYPKRTQSIQSNPRSIQSNPRSGCVYPKQPGRCLCTEPLWGVRASSWP